MGFRSTLLLGAISCTILTIAQAAAGGAPVAMSASQCSAPSSIVIEQRDLQFDHPDTALTVSVDCPCHAAHIRLACGPDWLQSDVGAADLTVLGDGNCLLRPNQVLPPYSSVTFLYQHSPPLVDLHPLDASFFNCTSASPAPPHHPMQTILFTLLLTSVILQYLARRSSTSTPLPPFA